ncbi:hypothetical protein BP6252_12960 [Coleophoma cylindrospora]|uniref:Oxidoreductase acuF-like C2H2 type zinc-finger domain-containing protein n=1 Tax=Coleophoma cylindrospora TaxID=1849047 RepID=A0A3D8QDD9_9HELO|nr:hypothetical protein BP6252_12960 [Coleophoma cylindrospora]
MAAIAEYTLWCMKGFSRLIATLATGEQEHRESMPPATIKNEYGRLRIWSGNLGALQSGRSSLDFRLRESLVMQSNVTKLLIKLNQILQRSIQVASGARLPLERLPEPDYSSDSSSDDESGTEDEDVPKSTELSQHMLTVKDILADLFKLSFVIRNAATRTRSLNPTLYKEIDEETKVDKFAAYSSYDYNHVLESFKQLRKDVAQQMSRPLPENDEDGLKGVYLIERLAMTITMRRRALRYWQRHAKKLSVIRGGPSGDSEEALMDPTSFSTGIATGNNADHFLQPSVENGHNVAQSVMEKSVLSGTEATRYDSKLDISLDTQSVISYASTAFGSHGNIVDLPPAPVAASNGTEFLCPYCGIVCAANHGQGRAWKTHVLQDLQPYICTYPHCSEAVQMYSKRHAWLEHERLVHRRVWRCFDHADAVFGSSAKLRQHLQLQHRTSVTETQIRSLIDVCESSVADTRAQCPICLLTGPFKKGLDNHLAFHLETFATFSISRGNFSEEPSESQDGMSKRAQGPRSDVSTLSSSLSFQSHSTSTSSNEQTLPHDELRKEEDSSTKWWKVSESVEADSNMDIGSKFPTQSDSEATKVLNEFDKKPESQPEYTKSIENLEDGLQEARQAVEATPKDHPEFAKKLNILYWYLCRRTENREDLDEAIAVGEEVIMLADYADPKKLEEAEKRFQHIQPKPTELNFASPLTNVTNMASLYWEKERWEDAEKLDLQVIEIEKRVFGLDNLDTAKKMAKLASTYRYQGRLTEAEELESQVMEMRLRLLGQEHADTLTSMTNLACIHRSQGRWKEAEELDLQVIETRKTVLGLYHQDTQLSMNTLARIYRDQERWQESRDLELQILERRKTELGLEDPATLASMSNLASTYRAEGRWKEAEELEAYVTKTSKGVQGLQHPNTLSSMENLASIYGNQGRWEEAITLLEEVVKIRTAMIGEEHPSQEESTLALSHAYLANGQVVEAVGLLERVVQIQEHTLAKDHSRRLASQHALALAYHANEQVDDAVKLLEQVVKMQEAKLAEDDPDRVKSRQLLASWMQHK